MRERVATVAPEQTVLDASRLMREHGCGMLPVVDRDGRVRGVITDRDIVVRVCAGESPLATTRVGAAMTRELVACEASDSLREAEDLLMRHKKQRILVLEAGKLQGIVSLSDIAQVEQPLRAAQLLREVTAREVRVEHA